MTDWKPEGPAADQPAQSPRQPEPGEILRARPIKGPVDYEALTREHMARYPKIRAALREAELREKK